MIQSDTLSPCISQQETSISIDTMCVVEVFQLMVEEVQQYLHMKTMEHQEKVIGKPGDGYQNISRLLNIPLCPVESIIHDDDV